MKGGLFTQYEIKLSSSDKARVLSLILSNSLTFQKTYSADENSFYIIIKSKYKKAYEEILSNNQINASFFEIRGKLNSFVSIKARLGLMFGIVFLLSVLILSSNIIWKIDIEGNSTVSDEEILKELSSAGLNEGTYIPGIDYDELQNKILLNSKNLSWISINITGNVATVQVKEKSVISQEPKLSYSNVVAKSDGYISEIRVLNGKKIAYIGQVVRKGDILISGVVNSQSQGVRYEEAKGEVMAYVNKEIKIEIPYKNSQKIYTGTKYTCKDYKLYNFYINFSSKYGNQDVFYDKIEKREKISVFGIKSIPLEVITTSFYEYKYVPVELSKQEAIDKAFVELREKMDKALSNAELINKKIDTAYDENGFYIYCQLYCLEDIAKTQEIYVID